MTIEASKEAGDRGRIRLGMVGGGQGAFIGTVHRIADRIDDHFELVAGALASDPLRAKARGWFKRVVAGSPETALGGIAKIIGDKPQGS